MNQHHSTHPATYCDSVVLMRLQQTLAREPGVLEAAAMMATSANREILEEGGWWPEGLEAARADDLLVVVRAETDQAARDALGRVEELLRARVVAIAGEQRPYRSLAAATKERPDARWVAISVPGAYAADVAEEALLAGRHVFLYSDNVAIADELRLKRLAAARGLLLLGPDCGTAAIGGLGLGFANRLEVGGIGLVGASGTGLQAVSCRIDFLGTGVSHIIGTGGRDLSEAVGALSTLAAVELLDRDPHTHVIVVVSKPPSPKVAARVLRRVRSLSTPVVVCFVGAGSRNPDLGSVHFAASLDEAAETAVELLGASTVKEPTVAGGGYVRGLFSGGTLALEVAHRLAGWLAPLATNLGLGHELEDPRESVGHTIVDLGADELTVGRPHPMIDPSTLYERLAREADDRDVGLVILDVVLGDGAYADPAAGLGPVIELALAQAQGAGRSLEIVCLVVGTRHDPQDLSGQIERLRSAGARVVRELDEVVRIAAEQALSSWESQPAVPIALDTLERPTIINVGLDSFASSIIDQGGEVVRVEWRPPAGGNEKLAAILRRMKRPGSSSQASSGDPS